MSIKKKLLDDVQNAYDGYMCGHGIVAIPITVKKARKHNNGDLLKDFLVIETNECCREFHSDHERLEGLRQNLYMSIEAIQGVIEVIEEISQDEEEEEDEEE